MNALEKDRMPQAIAVCAAVAGSVLVVAVGMSGNAIGNSVTALVGGSFALGLVGCLVKEALERKRGGYAPLPYAAMVDVRPVVAPVIIDMPRFADATASDYEAGEPAFAPITSLTEVQVQRERAQRRQREREASQTRA